MRFFGLLGTIAVGAFWATPSYSGAYCAVKTMSADGSYGICPNNSGAIQNGQGDFYCANDQCIDAGSTLTSAMTSPAPTLSGSPAPMLSGSTATAQSVSTAAALEAATRENFQNSVNATAMGSSGTQQTSIQDAQRVSSLGANYAATIGAVFCAEGANKAIEDSSQSAEDLAACGQHFIVARKLTSAPLQPDPAVLAKSGAASTLESFEKNFGVTRDAYLSRLLGAGGSRETLSDMLGSQIPEAKLKAAFEAADALPAQAAPDFSVNLAAGGSRAPAAASTALREKLKARMESAATPEAPQENRGEIVDANADHLEPLARGDFMGRDETSGGSAALTLFEVVHLKYADLLRHHRPR